MKCQSCQAISVFKPERVAQNCDFCGSPALVPYDEIKAPIRPESVLPFKLSQGDVRDKVHAWYRSRWFAPNRFKNRAFTDTIHGLYLPYWTFDAQVAAQWTAEAGYYYYTTETYRDSKGNSQTRQVQHTRWESASGALDHFFDDELVPASRGVPAELLRRIEPFPTKELAPYDAGYVSGWVVEQYQIDLVAAAAAFARNDGREAAPAVRAADSRRHVSQSAGRGRLQRANFQARPPADLAPELSIRRQDIPHRGNGFTGAIAGKYPKSWIKIGLLVLVLVILGLIIFSSPRVNREQRALWGAHACGVLVAAFCGDETFSWRRSPRGHALRGSPLRQNAATSTPQACATRHPLRTSPPVSAPWSNFAPSCACPAFSPACSRRIPSR